MAIRTAPTLRDVEEARKRLDGIELGAVERFLGDAAPRIAMSSTKSATGHLMGASGAFEGVATVLSVFHQCAPAAVITRAMCTVRWLIRQPSADRTKTSS